MSDLSDQVDAALKAAVESNTKDEDDVEYVDIEKSEVGQTPGLNEMRGRYIKRAATLINTVYRQHAGSAPFTSPYEAFERTKEGMTQVMVPMFIQAFSDGVQMGQAKSPAWRKYNMFKKLDRVFESDSWQAETQVIALPFQDDYETRELFERYLTATIGHVGSSSGYSEYRGDKLNKIWDLWALSASSVVIGSYAAGLRLGKKWSEQDTLAGIMAATEANDG